MASSSESMGRVDLTVEPDLQPLYPTPSQLAHLLSPNVGLSPSQKAELVSHCLTRTCAFGDFTLLSYLLSDPHAQPFIDLGKQDEDGLGLISIAILGFGSEGERDVEREECVRLLVSEGADVNLADHAGWVALHHAALVAPPTLVSHLLTHGSSPFALTRRQLTALDIVTARTTLPGREDVALLLEEAMREKGWTGGRMEEKRRKFEKRVSRHRKRKELQESVGKVLRISSRWWGDIDAEFMFDVFDEDEDEDMGAQEIFTPSPDYTSMLVFAPHALPDIFQSLIIDYPQSLRNAEPANVLYMLARFACLNCDNDWLEDLVVGATDAIEDTFFNRGDDLTCLVFWLYNITVWLHLMRCDEAMKETCELLGSYTLIEEILNSVFVFIIRFAERRIDGLLDAALLDYSPLSSEFDSVQFESEWSILRTFQASSKKKPTPLQNSNSLAPGSPTIKSNTGTVSPSGTSRPSSPPPSVTPTKFASLRQTFSRARASSTVSSPQVQTPPPPSPNNVTTFMTALQTLLVLSDINPALITQLWSQVFYWAACEMFNRILTRKKYLCRSRAVQMSMNVSALEEWVGNMELPRGISSHFAPVKDLLNWLQCLSSINEFSNLIATIQTMKHINPLQMRRAVRDYKYEVNEGRMTEECIQYLAQLQKDWERHRVKIGVEALRKEIGDRERDREDEYLPSSGSASVIDSVPPSPCVENGCAQRNIDLLFDRGQEKSVWEPPAAPDALGELLDSRHMLSVYLPSDPRLLGAVPGKRPFVDEDPQHLDAKANGRSVSRASQGTRGAMMWRLQSSKLREVGIRTLQSIDGARSTARWYRPLEPEPEADDDDDEDDDQPPPPYTADDPRVPGEQPKITTHLTPLTKSRSSRSRGRGSTDVTPVDSETAKRLQD
ncbi:hypothetical protein NM688_g5158 [Phlebia brevispora]|uniref:Uncharacterized protein n=1 Tax=Phlebia brevispora TaxID=194682 RepID=A0ACC1SZP0_9APHY|nr:hypothetical protein NM688_g5158 [Phlebia brevispora]